MALHAQHPLGGRFAVVAGEIGNYMITYVIRPVINNVRAMTARISGFVFILK